MGIKDITKAAWNPAKDLHASDFKGINHVAGWVGKGTKAEDHPHDHVARPLAALKDPSEFGPPPKNVNYHGGAAHHDALPPRTNFPAPSGPDPLIPTATALLPATPRTAPPPPPSRPKPALPPRLPPRDTPHSHPASVQPAQPPPSLLNRSALSRLAASGIHVPALGISPSPPPSNAGAALAPSGKPPPSLPHRPDPASGGGTSFAQKRAALRSATNFYADPASVSLDEARLAARTADDFRERHGEQVLGGIRAAGRLEERYGVGARVAGAVSEGRGAGVGEEGVERRKPPPVPRATKPG